MRAACLILLLARVAHATTSTTSTTSTTTSTSTIAFDFWSGFERATDEEFGQVSGSPAYSSSSPITGGFSLFIDTTSTVKYVRFNAATSRAVRYLPFRIRVAQAPSSASEEIFVCSSGSGSLPGAFQLRIDSTRALRFYDGTTALGSGWSSYTLPDNVAVQLMLTGASASDEVALYAGADPTAQAILPATVVSGLQNVDRCWAGRGTNRNSVRTQVYYDDVIMHDSAPGNVRILARQSTTGTPNVDAWTKNSCTDTSQGCTSGTVCACWQETPYGTTSNASTTGNASQTAIIGAFNATQTGKGSQVVAAGDSIRTCRMSVEATRTSGTAGTYNLRRRINGTNADEAVVIAVGAALYQQADFTPTAASHMDTAEVGMTTASNARTVTVYDAWMECAVVPGVLFQSTAVDE